MTIRRPSATTKRPAAIDIVSRLQRVDQSLSPAERRVADIVTSDYEAATRMTIAELAARADVSQPTVTRFCRSVGCASFSEFKISLATTLTGTYARTHGIVDFQNTVLRAEVAALPTLFRRAGCATGVCP